MENYTLIIAGIIGSVVTLFITAILDIIKELYKTRLELRKLFFQRKIDIVEKGISWLQESIDCLKMMQTACNDIIQDKNLNACDKLIESSLHANKLYQDSNIRLNQIYLYYDFSDIERKYNLMESYAKVNECIKDITTLNQKLTKSTSPNELEENSNIQEKVILKFRELSYTIENQINTRAEIIIRLREDYKKYN